MTDIHDMKRLTVEQLADKAIDQWWQEYGMNLETRHLRVLRHAARFVAAEVAEEVLERAR